MPGQTRILYNYALEARVVIISYSYYFKAIPTSCFVRH